MALNCWRGMSGWWTKVTTKPDIEFDTVEKARSVVDEFSQRQTQKLGELKLTWDQLHEIRRQSAGVPSADQKVRAAKLLRKHKLLQDEIGRLDMQLGVWTKKESELTEFLGRQKEMKKINELNDNISRMYKTMDVTKANSIFNRADTLDQSVEEFNTNAYSHNRLDNSVSAVSINNELDKFFGEELSMQIDQMPTVETDRSSLLEDYRKQQVHELNTPIMRRQTKALYDTGSDIYDDIA